MHDPSGGPGGASAYSARRNWGSNRGAPAVGACHVHSRVRRPVPCQAVLQLRDDVRTQMPVDVFVLRGPALADAGLTPACLSQVFSGSSRQRVTEPMRLAEGVRPHGARIPARADVWAEVYARPAPPPHTRWRRVSGQAAADALEQQEKLELRVGLVDRRTGRMSSTFLGHVPRAGGYGDGGGSSQDEWGSEYGDDDDDDDDLDGESDGYGSEGSGYGADHLGGMAGLRHYR